MKIVMKNQLIFSKALEMIIDHLKLIVKNNFFKNLGFHIVF